MRVCHGRNGAAQGRRKQYWLELPANAKIRKGGRGALGRSHILPAEGVSTRGGDAKPLSARLSVRYRARVRFRGRRAGRRFVSNLWLRASGLAGFGWRRVGRKFAQ